MVIKRMSIVKSSAFLAAYEDLNFRTRADVMGAMCLLPVLVAGLEDSGSSIVVAMDLGPFDTVLLRDDFRRGTRADANLLIPESLNAGEGVMVDIRIHNDVSKTPIRKVRFLYRAGAPYPQEMSQIAAR